jgi:hypothetical protein
MGKNNKNKAQRNAGFKSDAQIIFEGKQILNERPSGMDRDTYRFLRKTQSLILKQLFHKGHSPSRKLSGLMGQKQPPIAKTAKGARRIIKQRKAS